MTVENCEVLDDLLPMADVCRAFNRSELTILHWRQRKGMPYVLITGSQRPTIRFRLSAVEAWAKKWGFKFSKRLLDLEPTGVPTKLKKKRARETF